MTVSLRVRRGFVLVALGLWAGAAHAAPRTTVGPPESEVAVRRDAAPVFSHRAALDRPLAPVRSGSLPPVTGDRSSYAPIELASGNTLLFGAPSPRVAADLAQASAAMRARRRASPTARGAHLLQFSAVSAATARRRIERAGGTIVAAPSDGTFLVRMDEPARAQLAAQADGPWMESYEPAYKISARIDRDTAEPAALTALVFPDGDADAVVRALYALGAAEVRLNRNGINQLVSFTLRADRAADVAGFDDVAWMEPAPRDSLLNTDAQWIVQTNVPQSRRVWDVGLRGQNQIVMISDSGVRTNHEMFDDPAVAITDFGAWPSHRKIIAYDRGSAHAGIEFGDDVGAEYHGTHTSGTLAGNNDATTTNPYDGIAKDAKLWFVDLSGPTIAGSIARPDDLNDLFMPSYLGNAAGAARISSNSWGSPGNGWYTLAAMQVDQFMWSHPDYLVVFANGNSQVIASVVSPATAKNCISVGGTGNGENRTSIFRQTSRGPTNDLRRKPTIAAPGQEVGSSVGTTRWAYFAYSGTSMAAPAAAGAMALARQYLTEGWYPAGAPVAAHTLNPSAALLKAMAINSGENDVAGTHVPDNNVGWGRLNLDNVLYFPGDTRRLLLVDADQGLMDRQFVEYEIPVSDPPQPLSISLCWTDAPGHPLFVRQLVNDLDLVVTNGVVTYVGNRMFNGVSLEGPGRDSLNVEECVRIPTPAPGVWTVRVEASRIGFGPQPYALCITGGLDNASASLALDRHEVGLNDAIEIELLDNDASAPVTVTATTPTDPTGEVVALEGTSGVWRGRLVLAPAAPNPHDHRLAVSSGDIVTVTYADATSGTTRTATAHANATAPIITDVHARALGSTSALVSWTTDVPAASRVRYGDTGTLASTAGSDNYTREHSVRLTDLRPGRTYAYDVESAARTGGMTRDSFGGVHRRFTTRAPGRIALVVDEASTRVLDTWTNAFDALGWEVDIFTGADADPPLVGNRNVGLRSYACVLWQAGPDKYPPISDRQGAAIDSLLEGGARLLVTGHDLGYGMADASVFSYTPEREAWLERSLKTRYHYDEWNGVSLMLGASGDPVSGSFVDGVAYHQVRSGSTSDLVRAAPSADGVATESWFLDTVPPWPCGVRWESHADRGHPVSAYWGGQRSRLLALYFEWAGLATPNSAPAPLRTDVLAQSVAWLLGRQPPAVHLTAPAPGALVAGDVLPIAWTADVDAGRTVGQRSLAYSLDGGESWTALHTSTSTDGVYAWNLAAAGIPNTARALLRVTVTDDGLPALSDADVTNGVFTIARPNGDRSGPVLVAGSLRTTPHPVRATTATTIVATFDDAARGAGLVEAAEFGIGATPPEPGTGSSMEIATPASVAEATATVAANSLAPGPSTLWVRARDAAGNWGPATALAIVVNAPERTDITAAGPPATTSVAAEMPHGQRGTARFRVALAAAGDVRLELYDVRGRRVRSVWRGFLPAGTHVVPWDGRDEGGSRSASGIYFARLTTPTGMHRTRLVLLH